MNKKRLCCFYVSDIHLITMLLPYINERINESTQIITIFENDMSKSAKKVIKGIQGKKSESLLQLDWKQKNLNVLNNLDISNKLILISGNDEFIKEANKLINNKNENCEILNCYEIMQGSSKLHEILDMHEKVVNTSGEKNPEEIFTGYKRKVYKEVTL